MRRIPAYCPESIFGVRAGDTLAGCDWKELIFLGDAEFAIYYWSQTSERPIKPVRKRGFAAARSYYNSLPYPER